MPNWTTLPTPTEMVRFLDRFVHGQDRAKRDLATCVYRHYLAVAYSERHPESRHPFGRRHLLLLGPTGAGKTYLVTTLASYLGVPVTFGSAASLVENGYHGEHIDAVFRRLLVETHGDTTVAERAIVFVDEIDKIRRQEGSSRDVAGEGVQTSLLAPLDGCPVEVRFEPGPTYTLDTSRMLFVCTGAFGGLPEVIRRRLGAGKCFGFHPGADDPAALSDDEVLARGELQDLEAYGFIPEFLGRFAVISTVKSLSQGDLVSILRDTEDSPLARQRRWFAQHGVQLTLSDDALEAIADIALRSKTNARGLERILAKTLSSLDFRLPELAAGGVRAIALNRQAVLGEAEPIVEREAGTPRDPATIATGLRSRVAELLTPTARPAPSRRSERRGDPAATSGAGPAGASRRSAQRLPRVRRRGRRSLADGCQLRLPFE
ncbi:MAG: AAA family ATPase [Phycisphaerales bacterium]|nr:AAA family ATPase [Phycisphaerales bacterium]